MSKKIVVVNEKWFTTAPIEDIMSLGLRVLEVPVANLDGKDEKGQRTLIRQVFKQREEFDFGQEFEVTELNSNPFKKKGAAMNKRTPRTPMGDMSGPYKVVKCRLRASENDERWNVWGIIARSTSFEECFAALSEKYGDQKLGTKGAMTFEPKRFVQWSLKCGWIIKV